MLYKHFAKEWNNKGIVKDKNKDKKIQIWSMWPKVNFEKSTKNFIIVKTDLGKKGNQVT